MLKHQVQANTASPADTSRADEAVGKQPEQKLPFVHGLRVRSRGFQGTRNALGREPVGELQQSARAR
jgi:hypothetical protein